MDLTDLRPKAKRKLDQFGVTEETLAARANFLASRGFLTDGKVLFLGDYDLTSLAVLPVAKNTEVWALDIDCEVLDVIKRESGEAIRTVQHNLCSPLPKRLIASFDCIFVDPPYSPGGITLFLSRALEALTKGKRARIILSYGASEKAPERMLTVQKKILEHSIVIEELLPGFNEYLAAKTIGDRSDLYILRLTPRTKPLVQGEYRGKIYTYER